MKPANRINQINEYYFSTKLAEIKKMQDQGKDIINLGIGSPDLPPHRDVIQKLKRGSAFPENNMYQSYRGIHELRSAFSRWYERIYQVTLNPNNEILPLVGSKEGIMHICMAFCNPGDTIILPNPAYPTYSSVAKLLGLNIQYYNLKAENDWLPDLKEIESLMNTKCKMVWINYPNMPTGKIADFTILQKLVKLAKSKNVLLVNDNPYSLILNPKPLSLLSFLRDYENVIELNSLSKSHNMSGWRVGMVGGHKENIDHILKVKSNFDSGMYKPIQLAAVEALNLNEHWYEQQNHEYSIRKVVLFDLLKALKCTYNDDSAGLFVWAKIPHAYKSGEAFSDYLLYEKEIFATPGIVFGSNGAEYIRFSLCAPARRLKDALLRVNSFKTEAICN